ncbi:MAG: 3,4-dihydroxy-2-butanone-4-phosphate synthase [Desulfuromonas sp.]|nr:MAG: 3,4-dihydroxy-2-butanone-4-phosphate synthase [Desulfuromonas sp.]
MNQTLDTLFGNSFQRVQRALESLQRGHGVIVTDDEDRENEGDLIYSAEHLTHGQMALLIRECSGIVCLCLTEEKVDQLQLPMMVANNQSHYQTAFTVSIEAAEGVTTGVSAADRVTTIHTAAAADCTPAQLHSPGHVFPLKAKPGGVLERRGHTEATVDLMSLAKLNPCGVLCEVTLEDGTMARMPDLITFAQKHHLPLVTIEDIVRFKQLD